MGILKKFFRRKRQARVQELPTGSMTVNAKGDLLTSTVSSNYSRKLLTDVSREVLGIFREAREAQLPLAEFTVHFGSLRITAREMRNGAVIFLLPATKPAPTQN
ncbi:MAG: hypothetical protein KGR98_11070 [Verrucomicrobia bacterium]|nr:hypothetical protein [Verrucomicrobiota bacterium]MDE3099030.1 hypothetical protein [Verrucomicrobiota bacterium]